MTELTKDQRKELEAKLIRDLVNSARSDSSYCRDFVEDVMTNGYTPLSQRTDAELLEWHQNAFDYDFLEEE